MPISSASTKLRMVVAAEQHQRHQRQHHRQRRVQRARQRLGQAVVDDVLERLARVAHEVLADAVEDHDRVVHGEADDRQHRHDERRFDLDLGREQATQNREDAEHDQRIVHQRRDGAWRRSGSDG